MQNIINFYYRIKPEKIINRQNNYFFYLNNLLYNLTPYYKPPEEIEEIYKLNQTLSKYRIHKIIPNKDNSPLTPINNNQYILLQINVKEQKKISLAEINYLSNLKISSDKLIRSNWYRLWIKKIDYFEQQINQMGKQYPYLVDSFNYFIGLAENAISYLKTTLDEYKPEPIDVPKISHDRLRLNDTSYDFYHPLNIILDHKSRDLAEYIKNSFFNNNFNIIEELTTYFNYNYYSHYGMRLLVARILYPSFYFDLYEQVITNQIKEYKLTNITSQISNYELYLKDIFLLLKKYYNLEDIDWILRKK